MYVKLSDFVIRLAVGIEKRPRERVFFRQVLDDILPPSKHYDDIFFLIPAFPFHVRVHIRMRFDYHVRLRLQILNEAVDYTKPEPDVQHDGF